MALPNGRNLEESQAVPGGLFSTSDCKYIGPYTTVLNFTGVVLKRNNLGGLNDPTLPSGLLYGNVGIQRLTGRALDLEVQNLSAYIPQHPEQNGIDSSLTFGVVNLRAPLDGEGTPGVDWSFVTLAFTFRDSETGAVTYVEDTQFSVFDLDEGFNDRSTECLGISNANLIQVGPAGTELQEVADRF